MRDCRCATGDSPQEVLLRMLHSAADCGHSDMPEGQRNTSSLLSQTLCLSAAWINWSMALH